MVNKITMLSVAIIMCCMFVSCELNIDVVEAPPAMREEALLATAPYIGMPYIYGGGDWAGPRHVDGVGGIDCSGLVVNVYKRAATVCNSDLLFTDATVNTLFEYYTKQIDKPEPGDLIFMGYGSITHVAIYSRTEHDLIYFVDAYSLSGLVQERSYQINDPKIISFGRMLVKR